MAISALLVGMIFKIGAVPLLLEVDVQCLLQVSFYRIFNTAGALVVITVKGITHPLHFLLRSSLAHSLSILTFLTLYLGIHATVLAV